MRFGTVAGSASALLVLATAVEAKSGLHDQHEFLHRRQIRDGKKTGAEQLKFEKRLGQCQFPSDAGLVAVTPGSANAGWAMSPDQSCTPGSYCPYACPPGQISMQWDPSAVAYTYPQSMNGGLYCNSNGTVTKPFPDKPYCQTTAANIGVVNNAGSIVSFCQTVLPGNEAMLIPTGVNDYATLANPGTDYWCGTAAHYYVNPPGTSTTDACLWGTNLNPTGNWSPYVAGSNVDASGNTYIKLGWNPVYLELATPFRNTMPSWGVKIDCPNGGCTGLPCSIDPSSNQVNGMSGSGIAYGAGGASFCVVTVQKGATANFVVYGGSTGGSTGASSTAAGTTAAGTTAAAPSASSGWNNWNGDSSYVNNRGSATSGIAAASKSAGNPLGISAGAPDMGGQFFASSGSGSSGSGISQATGSSSISNSATPKSTEVSTSTAMSSSYTTWTGYNMSSAIPTGPTGSPYYSLFNSSATATKTAKTAPLTGTAHTTAASGTQGSSTISIAKATGAASQVGMGAVGFAVALWSLLM